MAGHSEQLEWPADATNNGSNNNNHTGVMMEQQRRFNLDDYETVEARLEKFWAAHPHGRIITEPIVYADGQFIFKAEIYVHRDDAQPTTTGWAEERVGQGMVNKTSALENCETSAIGRALANMGFATKGKRASQSEMAKVVKGNSEPPKREVEKRPKKLPSNVPAAHDATDKIAEAYVRIGLASSADELKVIWADNADVLDVEHNGTTIRKYIMQRKDEVQ